LDDARFSNELAALDRWGAARVYIVRPGLAHDGHASENSIGSEHFTHVIQNDGTQEELLARGLAWFVQMGISS